MAKISKHGGPSVEPDQPVRIVRAEIGYSDQPVVVDEFDAAKADRETAAEEAKDTEAKLAKAPAAKKSTAAKK